MHPPWSPVTRSACDRLACRRHHGENSFIRSRANRTPRSGARYLTVGGEVGGYVLHDMAQSGSFALVHASHKPAGGWIGAAVLLEAGQIARKTIDEALAEARCWQLFKDPEINGVPHQHHANTSVVRRAFVFAPAMDSARMAARHRDETTPP